MTRFLSTPRGQLSFLLIALLGSGAACGGSSPKGNGMDGAASGGTSGGMGGNSGGTGAGGMAGGTSGTAGGTTGMAGGTTGMGGSAAGGATGTGGTGGAGGSGTVPVTCMVTNPQCNDGIDNDADMLKDLADLQCASPCDNDEGSFATGIPGDNMDACKQDCFFDGNSGMGDDGCNWDLSCDPNNPGGTSCPYVAGQNPAKCATAQSPKCVRNCARLAPNGCDCFGCCQVTVAGQTFGVALAGTCTSSDKFGDPAACPRCTLNTACMNPCDTCEVCFGKPAPDASCGAGGAGGMGGAGGAGGSTGGAGGSTGGAGGSGSSQCAAGVTSCGPGGQVAVDGCMPGYFCQTGCCVQFVID